MAMLTRNETVIVSQDSFNTNAASSTIQNRADPYSFSIVGQLQIYLPTGASKQVVNLPTNISGSFTGGFLRVESTAAISFQTSNVAGATAFTLVIPSSSSSGYPITGVCSMDVSFTNLYLSNTTGSNVLVSIIVGGN